jgi:hypothetical protein
MAGYCDGWGHHFCIDAAQAATSEGARVGGGTFHFSVLHTKLHPFSLSHPLDRALFSHPSR